MREDIQRWQRKYAQREPEATIEPDALLRAHQRLLTGGGLGIDLAGGTGDNGLYLCGLGYRTIVIDASETGLRLCRHKAGVNGLRPMLVAADLDRFTLPPSTFDIALVFRYLNRSLIGPIRDCLRPGGLLFYKTFNIHHLRERPGFNRDYVLAPGELREWFAGLDCIASNDGEADTATWHWVGRRPEYA